MLQDAGTIQDDSFITEIVTQNYRTSEVFLKHGIDYCCKGKHTLRDACESKGINVELVKQQLNQAINSVNHSSSLEFNDWPIDFLIDYIEYVHHHYLRDNLSIIEELLSRFVHSQNSKYNSFSELMDYFAGLKTDLLPHLEKEEKIIFPYIKQVAHAYASKESYASLFIRTLRKPLEQVMHHEDEKLAQYIHRFRKLTNNYSCPIHASIAQRVCFAKLKELDNDLTQHMHLENNILFPKAIKMEEELLLMNEHPQ
jgi:regulator of cell morphogenesis and NO signaling